MEHSIYTHKKGEIIMYNMTITINGLTEIIENGEDLLDLKSKTETLLLNKAKELGVSGEVDVNVDIDLDGEYCDHDEFVMNINEDFTKAELVLEK